jgi:hypothetical protein
LELAEPGGSWRVRSGRDTWRVVGVTLGGVVGVGVGSVASSVENTILPTRIERGNDCDVMLDCPVVIAPAVPLLAAFPTTNG